MLLHQDNPATATIKQFVRQASMFDISSIGETIKAHFENNPHDEGVIVTDAVSPVGIIMRSSFFQKLGSLYGNSLYLKRSISILMDTHYMTSDINDQLSDFSAMAMSREAGKKYDYALVFENRRYAGVISIQQFLAELSRLNEAQISLLKDQHRKLIGLNEQEQKLRKKIEYQSDAVRNLLDNADQGFLWFGHDLEIKKDFSYKCSEIFEQKIGGLNYLELIKPFFSEEKIEVCSLTFNSYFENSSPLTDNVYLMLLPQVCIINQKHIKLQYRRIEHKGKKALMIMLSDQTEKIKMQEELEQDRYRQRLIIKSFSSQNQIRQLLDDIKETLNGAWKNFILDSNDRLEGLNSLFRIIHTYKGELAQYGFMQSSDIIHKCEDDLMQVLQSEEKAEYSQIESIMNKYTADTVLQADLNTIREMSGPDLFATEEKLLVDENKIQNIIKIIEDENNVLNRQQIIRLISSLKCQSLKKLFEDYRDYLGWLSGRLNKSMPAYVVDGDDVEVDPLAVKDFLQTIVHVFRNSIDHGLENDEERLEAGKPLGGLIECLISKTQDNIIISIRDDGRGINIEKVRKKAIQQGILNSQQAIEMREQDLARLIFTDCFSTCESVSSTSGRGVGMSAVRASCECLGGDIEVKSQLNKGTSVVFTLPVNSCCM